MLEEHDDLGKEQEQPTGILRPEEIAQATVEDYVKHKRVRPARPARTEVDKGELLVSTGKATCKQDACHPTMNLYPASCQV